MNFKSLFKKLFPEDTKFASYIQRKNKFIEGLTDEQKAFYEQMQGASALEVNLALYQRIVELEKRCKKSL